MKRTIYIIIHAALAFAFCSCQDALEQDSRIGAVSFDPIIDGVTDTEMTKASAFRSEDGSLEIPALLEVSDGIAGQGIAAPAAFGTKGTLINTSGSSLALSGFASQIGNKFYVTAWKGTTPARFIPSSGSGYSEVTYSSSSWSTISTKWDGEEHATFFAYANLPASGAAVDNENATTQALTYSAVPTSASTQTDILLGYYYGTGSPNTTGKTCTAELQFHHPLTAVRFKKGEISGNAVSFKAIYVNGVYVSGKATLTASGETSAISWSDKSATRQEVGLEGSSYLAVDADGIIGESFLLIPQEITSSAPVTVTVVVEIDGTIHPLTATLAPVEWLAGKTYTYTLGYADYELTVDGEVSTDYQGNGARTYSVNSSAAWKLQYTTDGGTNWSDATAGSKIDGWISFDKVSGSGSSSAQTVTAAVDAATGVTTIYAADHNAALRTAAPKGTEDAPYDLSMHTIYGNERAAGPVTANCYVIDAPGWYAFPLVYGNAIDYNKVPSGGVNTQAFNPTGSGSDFLTIFQSSEGNISSPYITGATSAYPYWEDVPGYALIAQNGCTILNKDAAAAKGLTGCDCGYVVFQVNHSTLTQGNAVIAVSNASNVLWSWHIWVTDMDLTTRIISNTKNSVRTTPTFSKGVMPHNLGWVDLGSATGYPGKALRIRFVQIANGVVKNEVGKSPQRKDYMTESPNGQSPTWQWGRKDPFIRFKDDGSELTTAEYSGTGISFAGGSGSAIPISMSIKDPAQFIWEDGWRQGGGQYVNLWSATLSSITATGEGYTSAPVKTIYDPCPPGFQVPQMDAFDRWDRYGTDKTGTAGVWNYGYRLRTQDAVEEYIFFPATGYRNGNKTSSSTVKQADWYRDYGIQMSRYWTAAPEEGTGNRLYSYNLLIDQNAMSVQKECYKNFGASIRPVQETNGIY